jgi:hypothetical protein
MMGTRGPRKTKTNASEEMKGVYRAEIQRLWQNAAGIKGKKAVAKAAVLGL